MNNLRRNITKKNSTLPVTMCNMLHYANFGGLPGDVNDAVVSGQLTHSTRRLVV